MALTGRPAIPPDEDILYRWRVEDEQNPWWKGEPVTREGHSQWFQNMMASPNAVVLMAFEDGMPVGQCRIDSNGEISFSVGKEFRGRGIGWRMVRGAAEAYAQFYGGRLKACADRSNEAGIRTMEKAGFVVRPDVVFLRWPE